MLKNVTDTVFYVGVDDKDIDLFENQYIVPNGIAYNSYVIMDEKIAIMDMVDAKCADQWFANVAEVLGDRQPDYLIISHLEPDHSANLGDVLAKYPDIKIVSNAKLFAMLPNFFEVPVADRSVTVAEGQTLSLGSHTLQFLWLLWFTGLRSWSHMSRARRYSSQRMHLASLEHWIQMRTGHARREDITSI